MRALHCSFGSPGYLFPSVGLALELRARGHDVAVVSSTHAVPRLRTASLERIVRGKKDGPSFEVSLWYDPLATVIDTKHIEHALTQWHPDVLVTHALCQAALIAGERHGIPVAVMGFFAYLHPPVECYSNASDLPTRQWRLREQNDCYNRARRACGLPLIEATASKNPFLGDLFMLRTAPALEPELDLYPSVVHAVGACEWEPDPATASADDFPSVLNEWLKGDDAPIVYVHQGRSFGKPGFWRRLVDALADQRYRVVASVGRMDIDVGSLPANFFVRPHASQRASLSHAVAVVCSGHSSIVIGAITHQVPNVIIPSGGETADNAHRLLRAGCGVRLSMETLRSGDIVDALAHVRDDAGMCPGLKDASAALRAMGSFDAAADLVERLVSTGMPVTRSVNAFGRVYTGTGAG